MIVLVGESASGKTTLLNELVENHGYKKIVTYTTRPKREFEKDDVDYHFVDDETFQKMVQDEKFIEHNQYRGWNYGTAIKDVKKADDKSIIILTPAGLRAMDKAGIDCDSVYLYVDRRSRLIQLLFRGDDVDEAYRRNLSDVGQFDGIVKEADYVIDNSHYHMDEQQVVKCMLAVIKDITEDSNAEK